jgi:hypothetical protein
VGETRTARNDGLIARYEELRRQALGRSGAQGQGLVLFLRGGMRAWMNAWSQCAVPQAAPAHSHNDQDICPVQLQREVTMLLASMVWVARQEAIA